MENWRLSRIEVELGKLKLDLESPDVVSTLPEVHDDRKSPVTEKVTAEDDVLSKIVIRPAYSKSSRRKGDATKAVQMIKEKYDSPNAVTKSGLNAEPSRPTSAGFRVTDEATGAWKPSEPDICRVESQPRGQRLSLESSTTRLPVCESFQGSTPVWRQKSPSAVAAPGVAFDFNATVYHPPAAPSESPPRLCYGPRSPSRPGPPTTTKPPSSLYLGQLTTQHRYDQAKLLHGNSYLCTGEIVASSPVAAVQPPDLVMVQPFVPSDSPCGDTFLPDPPSDVFLQGYLLPQRQPRSPISTEPTVDFQAMPSINQIDESFLKAVPPPENLEMFNASDALEGRAGDPSYKLDHSFRKRSEPEQQTACEQVSMETHTIRHLADSYNCRPRYGTLKATRANPQRTDDPQSGDFFPPRGPCLTDDDRNQVEMFYRSHKSRVFVAKCEANLYFGSARRHSVVVPSKSAVARAAESPENWMFLKCGIPVLVLDSGESRRQRRLHIILAERGSGFVLWRDTFDHLTGYSVSPNVGFHTMHLSKDHTKLAGFYFSDSLSATEFFDFLSNLTSDPDDPLLSLSNGTKKKKKDRKKTGSGATSRKEKRKPIRREDISLPCCFTHVTKLDRNDGLHILLSDDSLLQQTQNDSHVDPTESSQCLPKTPLPV